jgi:GAF domain-containing protein
LATEQEKDHQAALLLEERRAALGLLRATYLGVQPQELAVKLALLARSYSGCEAVAIRLRKGPDFPYAASLGFDPGFLVMENSLCAHEQQGQILRDEHWHPILECMCGTVLSGQIDASRPYFTPAGSFYTQSTTQLLQGAVEQDQPGRTRNRCHTAGYESVGLFPIRLGDNVFGLIQCNDRQQGRFTPGRISLLEELAATSAHLFQLSML